MALIYAESETVNGTHIAAEVITGQTSPWVGLTLEGFGVGDSIITVWRLSGGTREAVSGAYHRRVVDSDFLIDYAPPLGREVTYTVEILDGPKYGTDVGVATLVIESEVGYIQDPLDPTSAVPLHGAHNRDGALTLRSGALAELEYAADMNVVKILGSNRPVALMGQRMAASGVSFAAMTNAAEQATALRNLLATSTVLLVRGLPKWGEYLPPVTPMAISAPKEKPVTVGQGGQFTRWELTGDIVAAPSAQILVALWTYQDVADLWQTYDQAQAAHTGTYLQDRKNPDA